MLSNLVFPIKRYKENEKISAQRKGILISSPSRRLISFCFSNDHKKLLFCSDNDKFSSSWHHRPDPEWRQEVRRGQRRVSGSLTSEDLSPVTVEH